MWLVKDLLSTPWGQDVKLNPFQIKLISQMIQLFSRYISVGVINTGLHWVCFGALVQFLGATQAVSNVVAFCVAVTFSFFANAKWTFKSQATPWRYSAFVLFMGAMAAITGHIADLLRAPPFITLILFSGFSLIIGFVYSKFIVFRDAK